MLVEFEAGKVPGLAFIAIQDELSDLVGRRVDLNTPASISPYFRREVLEDSEAVYVST